MATARVPQNPVTFEEAMELLSREERFMATVSAMNTLLIQKGIYSAEEFQHVFRDWAVAQLERPKNARPGWKR